MGTDAASFPSLTVVSLGNIYIEGALSVDSVDNAGVAIPVTDRKKLMLLAKKNVIVNPTRAVIGRTDVQTIATNTAAITLTGTAAAPKPFAIAVANIEAFNQGDFAEITSATIPTPIRGLITGVDTANSKLTINSAASGSIAAATAATPTVVRSPLEKRAAGTGASQREFFSLIDAENALNRRILVPFVDNSTPAYNKIVLDHVADLKKDASGKEIGFKIKADDISPAIQRPMSPTFIAELTNKQTLKTGTQDIDSTSDTVSSTNKLLRTYNNFTPANQKDLPNPRVAKTLAQLLTDALAVTEQRAMPPEGYKYVASLVDFPEASGDSTKSIANLPYHALAGVGVRYEPGATDTSINNRRQDFNAPKEVTVPLATSVEIDLNGASSWAKIVSGSLVTRSFGFAPAFGTTEDALTVDRSFYQTSDLISRSTLDSRILDFLSNPPVGNYGSSFVLRRSAATNAAAAPAFALLPDYRVRSLKYEYTNLNSKAVKPVADAIQINAFVYAQEGSWLVIPGAYFRSNPPVRGEANASGLAGSYIDYNDNKTADAGEFIYDGVGGGLGSKVADLNRNGVADKGEKEAALRFVRYNYAPIQFLGAIVENQTAVVGDVAAVATGAPPIVMGAVQDWTDKWATYADGGAGAGGVGLPDKFKFLSYTYDPSLASGSVGARGLRVPVTDDLIYQQ